VQGELRGLMARKPAASPKKENIYAKLSEWEEFISKKKESGRGTWKKSIKYRQCGEKREKQWA